MTSSDGSSGRVDPLWTEGLPANEETGKQNLGAIWLSSLRELAPLSPSQDALHGLLHALLCQGLVIDPLRSQPGHLLSTLLVRPGITVESKDGLVAAISCGCWMRMAPISSVIESRRKVAWPLGRKNRYKTLHGGAIGSLVEILGCAAIKSLAGTSDGTVTDINITYISGTPVMEEVEFEAKVLRVGRSIAVAAVDVRNKKSAKAAAQGRVTMCFDPTSKL